MMRLLILCAAAGLAWIPIAAGAPLAGPSDDAVASPVTQAILSALRDGPVYIDPVMGRRLPSGDAARIERAAQEYRVKVVVLADLPVLDQSVPRYAGLLHRQLALGATPLIVATRRSLAASTTALSAQQVRGLARQAVPVFSREGYGAGIETFARLLGDRLAAAERSRATRDLLIRIALAALVPVVGLWWVWRRRAEAAKVPALRQDVAAQAEGIRQDLRRLDEDLLSPQDLSQLTEARALRRQIADRFEVSSREIQSAGYRRLMEIGRTFDAVEGVILRASQVVGGRLAAERAAAPVWGPEAPGAPAGAMGQHAAGSGDPAVQGCCFFCGRRFAFRELQPVPIRVEGQTREVLACPEHAAQAREGNPQVLMVPDASGRPRPWYANPGYNPATDYHSGMWSLLTTMLLWQALQHRAHGAMFTDDPRVPLEQRETYRRMAEDLTPVEAGDLTADPAAGASFGREVPPGDRAADFDVADIGDFDVGDPG